MVIPGDTGEGCFDAIYRLLTRMGRAKKELCAYVRV